MALVTPLATSLFSPNTQSPHVAEELLARNSERLKAYGLLPEYIQRTPSDCRTDVSDMRRSPKCLLHLPQENACLWMIQLLWPYWSGSHKACYYTFTLLLDLHFVRSRLLALLAKHIDVPLGRVAGGDVVPPRALSQRVDLGIVRVAERDLVEVGDDPGFRDALGDHGVAPLDAPGEQDLRRRSADRVGDFDDDRVFCEQRVPDSLRDGGVSQGCGMVSKGLQLLPREL
ncbi:unnamed protein product [Mycena citricolor]|uniref:Uncharacterized protein n=1 Tax=Mycena citricolor TaxID=2018698 RepID=A0AAD2HJN3_9AGAR|nr:unnamed protein product [Mycena citricolor]